MHILNIHKRTYNVPADRITGLLNTLSSKNDNLWPNEKWPKMKMDNGLDEGSRGGHGPIGYFVESHIPGQQIVFRFTKPNGFNGVHKFDIVEIESTKTELVHTIEMNVKGVALFQWFLVIKWLHNALIEDGLDKLHNTLTGDTKVAKWNIWVRILRAILK